MHVPLRWTVSMFVVASTLVGCAQDETDAADTEGTSGGPSTTAGSGATSSEPEPNSGTTGVGDTTTGNASGASSEASGSNDASTTGEAESLLVEYPLDGAEVLFSVPLRIAPPTGTTSVEVAASGASCVAEPPAFECLLDLSLASAGPIDVTVEARDEAEVIDSLTMTLSRRELETPCSGDGGMLDACIVQRARAGQSAGFEGVSYLNADDTHALVNTSGMTGIDARVYPEPPPMVEEDVRMALMNESTAWLLDEGRCSLPRCFTTSRQARALQAYENNVFFACPEHRDVGIRDFYQWQAPFFLLSQGSSSSERDETAKGLRALGVMTTDARDAAETARVLGPTLAMLLVRSRHETDTEYLSAAAHPTAFPDAPSAERILQLAAALEADELPPVARVTADTQEFPEAWGMVQSHATPYALGFSPAVTPPTPHEGTFEVRVSLEASSDVNDRPPFVFPAILRDAGGTAQVERDGDGWVIRGDYPVDTQLLTGGQERTISRITVGFFVHNGVWLGAPAMVSVGGRAAEDAAPNANNLD